MSPEPSPNAVPEPFEAALHARLVHLGARGPGVLAVSGGADSTALACAVTRIPTFSLSILAHLNHQLRGTDSDADARFVAELCPASPHRIEACDVRAQAAGDNLEAAARKARYAFLTRIAQESGCAWVATAHTLDDQAETVLHRLLRGTGIRGLRGIAERRPLAPGIALLRPMLTISRRAVMTYLSRRGQPWREDVSNQDRTFTRNRIRHELLPVLRTFQPDAAALVARLADQARELFDWLQPQVTELLARCRRPNAGPLVILAAEPLVQAPDFLIREMLYRIWEDAGWRRGGMSHDHWQRAADVVQGRTTAWDLPDGIRIARVNRVIQLGPRSAFRF